MTDKDQFVFNYDKFEVKDEQIIAKYGPNDKYLKFKNCLLNEACNDVTDQKTTLTKITDKATTIKLTDKTTDKTTIKTTDKSTNKSTDKRDIKKRKYKSKDYLKIIMVGLVILTLLVIISVPFYLQFRRRNNFET